MLDSLPRNHYGAILCDPPWAFKTWSNKGQERSADNHYQTMDLWQIADLPVRALAADNCVLFLWSTWPMMPMALDLISDWGFTYKTCAFDWVKITAAGTPAIGMGYWTRSNSEPCLLATKGKPSRLKADVAQAILAIRREHSRKPEIVHQRIERLVAGPYLEIFARQQRPGWTTWGNETEKFVA